MSEPEEPSEPRKVHPRRDHAAGDVGALVELGVVEPPPAPEELPPPAPPAPVEPLPDPADVVENEVMLSVALAEAGVTPTADDTEAVAELSRMDPDTVAAVTKWLKQTKTTQPADPKK